VDFTRKRLDRIGAAFTVNFFMPRAAAPFSLRTLLLVACTLLLGGCASRTEKPAPPVPAPAPKPAPAAPAPKENLPSVMLGIDVLEADGFAALKGKRIGLLTHPAGVNRRGVPTVEVLRKAPGVKLVALYAVEHGIYNEFAAEVRFPDHIDKRTGLMVYSLYNPPVTKATPAQLKDIDALVVDMQDIGTRSYTFISAMKQAMIACFENNKEIIVLDRPNPLGGLKVSGPPLDADLKSYVGAFRVPYVHGLTIGELARMAKEAPEAPGIIAIPEKLRASGKLTVIPMRGWMRSTRWPETGLPFVPTSTRIQDFAAVMGYPMTGLGCIVGGFRTGVGTQYPFRGILHLDVKSDVVEKELKALNLPGLRYRRVAGPPQKNGQPGTGLFIEVVDYDEWQPCDLNFWLMKLACKLEPKNPFANLTPAKRREFLVHVGSAALLADLAAKGSRVDINAWLKTWREQAKIYQEQSKRFWLYR
jgi:uncharacterized protein YbbC (DUF1343 family)